MKKTLIYTCCDEKYYKFIPIFCSSLLFNNENIDIEIGIDNSELPLNQEKCLKILREIYPNSKILIKYNFFKKEKKIAVFENKKMLLNTVRFLSTPVLKSDYVYISDIDIISLTKNFSELHINDMISNGRKYSNKIRNSDIDKEEWRMTGLHFSEYNNYYPLPQFDDLKLLENDEMILCKIVNKRNEIDTVSTFRPVHGIHISPNRKIVDIVNPSWGLKNWENEWREFYLSKTFEAIFNLLDDDLKTIVKAINNYYNFE
jgi:hypothetical protein